MFRIKNYSNGQEDCFLIEIERESKKINILVDGGKKSESVEKCITDVSITQINYIVLTHIDNDHIKGILYILNNNIEKCKDTIIVYNKFTNGVISYTQAESFEKIIGNYEVIVSYKEYQQSGSEILFLSVEQRKKLQPNNSIYITFLSPSKHRVKSLYEAYKYKKQNGKLISQNAEIVNQSSIMFILEFEGKAILMAGDGYISDIISYISLLSSDITVEPLKKLDLIKIPHHGSKKNNLQLDILLQKMKCDKFIITNDNGGNVKIEDGLKNLLKDKEVYISAESNKYYGMNIKVIDVIDFKEHGK